MHKYLFLYYLKIDLYALIGIIIGSILSFIMPVYPFVLFAFVLIVCDLYTGTRAAKHRKEQIHSKGIGRSIEKMTLYFIAIILAEFFSKTFLYGRDFIHDFPIVYIVSITISIRELKSNYENIQEVTDINIWKEIQSKIDQIINIFKTKE